uniref:transcription factor bHLH130-like n=1 Tax=Erigeron canadensis TaxID=72917 RepID=UPI001CB8ECC4|nr:transcription factor bHLH130-like [Erigeron canadensis]
MYGGLNSSASSSDAISRDMNALLYSSSFKHPSDSEFAKIKQLISLDPYQDNYDNNDTLSSLDDTKNRRNKPQQDDTNNNNQGEARNPLMRNRSTPSSFFSNLLLNQTDENEFLDPETDERFFAKNEYNEHDFLQYEALKEGGQDLQKRQEPSLHHPNSTYGYMNSSDWDSASSNIARQTSSPSGFLSSLTNVKNDFSGMKEARKGSSSSTSNNHISFSLGSSSSSRFLPQIAETENGLHNSTFNSHKRSRDGGSKMSQNGETANRPSNLVHHMSLPKTSSEMDAVDNYLHFQQDSSVPWKTRAKRGFATHPRSIAERLRRTRISERIKRLQELFPDMDKQTNTADMLDMAVEYIKDLQKELQTLNDARARCTCSSEQLQSGSTM